MNNQKRRSYFNAFTNIYIFFSQQQYLKLLEQRKHDDEVCFVRTGIHCSDLLSFLRLLCWQLTFVEVDYNKNSDHHFTLKQFIEQLQPNGRSFF